MNSEQIRIGGVPGHEIVAESQDERTGDELVMVQWLRFGPGGVVQMFGIARKDQWADVLARACARCATGSSGSDCWVLAGRTTILSIRHTLLCGYSATMAAAMRPQAMPNEPEHLSTAGLQFWGLFAIALGALIILAAAGVLPSKGEDAPAWVVALAGLIFVFAGGLLLLRSFMGGNMSDVEIPRGVPLILRATYYVAGLTVVAALATIATWVAFGPGERAFSVSIPFLGTGPAKEWIGRGVFGFGAALIWLFFVIAAVAWWRKLIVNAPDQDKEPRRKPGFSIP